MKRPICVFVFIIILVSLSRSTPTLIVIDDFEKGLSEGWKEKRFEGKTIYSIVNEGDNHVLKAESSGSASGLIYEYEYDLKEYPILSWRWKIEGILKKGDATKKEGDDYPARVYVIFPHWFPPMTKSINYIWANKLSQGTIIPNTYYSKAVMVAVESGDDKAGRWVIEERNVYEDFKRIFKDEPPEAGGIAIMTDTDQTGERAVAYYDDIIIKK